jgi:hypothetical protein
MNSSAEERLEGLWLKAAGASDPTEAESLLSDFRDALHEYLDQCTEQTPRSLFSPLKFKTATTQTVVVGTV